MKRKSSTIRSKPTKFVPPQQFYNVLDEVSNDIGVSTIGNFNNIINRYTLMACGIDATELTKKKHKLVKSSDPRLEYLSNSDPDPAIPFFEDTNQTKKKKVKEKEHPKKTVEEEVSEFVESYLTKHHPSKRKKISTDYNNIDDWIKLQCKQSESELPSVDISKIGTVTSTKQTTKQSSKIILSNARKDAKCKDHCNSTTKSDKFVSNAKSVRRKSEKSNNTRTRNEPKNSEYNRTRNTLLVNKKAIAKSDSYNLKLKKDFNINNNEKTTANNVPHNVKLNKKSDHNVPHDSRLRRKSNDNGKQSTFDGSNDLSQEPINHVTLTKQRFKPPRMIIYSNKCVALIPSETETFSHTKFDSVKNKDILGLSVSCLLNNHGNMSHFINEITNLAPKQSKDVSSEPELVQDQTKKKQISIDNINPQISKAIKSNKSKTTSITKEHRSIDANINPKYTYKLRSQRIMLNSEKSDIPPSTRSDKENQIPERDVNYNKAVQKRQKSPTLNCSEEVSRIKRVATPIKDGKCTNTISNNIRFVNQSANKNIKPALALKEKKCLKQNAMPSNEVPESLYAQLMQLKRLPEGISDKQTKNKQIIFSGNKTVIKNIRKADVLQMNKSLSLDDSTKSQETNHSVLLNDTIAKATNHNISPDVRPNDNTANGKETNSISPDINDNTVTVEETHHSELCDISTEDNHEISSKITDLEEDNTDRLNLIEVPNQYFPINAYTPTFMEDRFKKKLYNSPQLCEAFFGHYRNIGKPSEEKETKKKETTPVYRLPDLFADDDEESEDESVTNQSTEGITHPESALTHSQTDVNNGSRFHRNDSINSMQTTVNKSTNLTSTISTENTSQCSQGSYYSYNDDKPFAFAKFIMPISKVRMKKHNPFISEERILQLMKM